MHLALLHQNHRSKVHTIPRTCNLLGAFILGGGGGGGTLYLSSSASVMKFESNVKFSNTKLIQSCPYLYNLARIIASTSGLSVRMPILLTMDTPLGYRRCKSEAEMSVPRRGSEWTPVLGMHKQTRRQGIEAALGHPGFDPFPDNTLMVSVVFGCWLRAPNKSRGRSDGGHLG